MLRYAISAAFELLLSKLTAGKLAIPSLHKGPHRLWSPWPSPAVPCAAVTDGGEVLVIKYLDSAKSKSPDSGSFSSASQN